MAVKHTFYYIQVLLVNITVEFNIFRAAVAVAVHESLDFATTILTFFLVNFLFFLTAYIVTKVGLATCYTFFLNFLCFYIHFTVSYCVHEANPLSAIYVHENMHTHIEWGDSPPKHVCSFSFIQILGRIQRFSGARYSLYPQRSYFIQIRIKAMWHVYFTKELYRTIMNISFYPSIDGLLTFLNVVF